MCIDFIGDLHGQAHRLRGILRELGYRERFGAYRHPFRRVVFLGDVLNRGPEIRECCHLVRAMVERAGAIFLLGNHEIFALMESAAKKGYFVERGWLEKARRRLATTQEAFSRAPSEWNAMQEWLWGQPVVWEGGGVRAVHACWHPQAVKCWRGRCLHPSDFCQIPSARFFLLWRIVEGPSLRHPLTGEKFRLRWWELGAQDWRQVIFSAPREIPAAPLSASCRQSLCPYPATAMPCFFGHYGFIKPPLPLTGNLACLDLGVAKGGPIGVYRWEGRGARECEVRLRADHLMAFS